MRSYVLRKLLLTVPVVIAVSTLVFLLVHLIPGDPTDFMVGENAALARKETVRRAHHFHLPILIDLWPLEPLEQIRARVVTSLQPGLIGEAARGALQDRSTVQAVQLYRLATAEPDPRARSAALEALLSGLERSPLPPPSGALEDPAVARQRQAIDALNAGIAKENAEIDALRAGLPALVGALATGAVGPTDGATLPDQDDATVLRQRLERLVHARGLASYSTLERLRDCLIETQYAYFFRDLLAGRFESLHTRRSVVSILRQKFPMTLKLGLTALIIAVGIAIPLGTIAAARQYSLLDNVSMLAALAGISMPNFWSGPLLILLFSIQLNWFPVSGAAEARSLVLPAVTLGLGLAALLTRMARASMLDVLRADYVRTARARGVSERKVLFKHALRNALVPIVTVLGLQFGAVLSGSIITEEIFGWPGLGRELVNAIRTRDFPLLQGCVLLISVTYVLVNLVTDLVYAWVDPRVKLE